MSIEQTIREIERYIADNYEEGASDYKLYYHIYEMEGWRFYLKAITHRDWRSLKEHILGL